MTRPNKKSRTNKGRQGRSHASRERARLNPPAPKNVLFCRECPPWVSELVDDVSTGDTLCGNCGLVVDSGGLNTFFLNPKNISIPYRRITHCRQRFRQLMGSGPQFTPDQIDEISLHLPFEKQDLAGKKTFSELFGSVPELKKIGLSQKSANHWIQIRLRLGLLFPNETNEPGQLTILEELCKILTPYLRERLEMRYLCVENAFVDSLFIHKHEKESSKDQLKRKSILSTNFTIAQLLRLESPEAFERLKCLLPQLAGKGQFQKNNDRWKIIIYYCNHFYQFFTNPKSDHTYHFDWAYHELDSKEINEFNFFI